MDDQGGDTGEHGEGIELADAPARWISIGVAVATLCMKGKDRVSL